MFFSGRKQQFEQGDGADVTLNLLLQSHFFSFPLAQVILFLMEMMIMLKIEFHLK